MHHQQGVFPCYWLFLEIGRARFSAWFLPVNDAMDKCEGLDDRIDMTLDFP